MVNTIVATNNINLVKRLLPELAGLNLKVNVSKVLTTKSEMEALLGDNSIDLLILDKDIIKECSEEFINKFKNIMVSLSYSNSPKLISNNILSDINSILLDENLDIKRLHILRELEYIGYRLKYKGTHYLLDTILQLCSKQNTMVDNLQSVIYPIVARKYNKSVYNVKSSINKATEHMYFECDSQRLQEYFNFPNDVKPTVKQVVFTVISKLK